MSTEKVSEMKDLVMAVGGPLEANENRKGYLTRVSAAAQISFRAAKAAFYGEPTSKAIAQKLKLAAGRNEARNLAARFESLAHSINIKDADFYSEDAAALINAARLLRGLDRTGTNDT